MRYTAIGESRAGCHEIPPSIAARFIDLGGDDIQVWDTEYVIDAHDPRAIEYAVTALCLEGVEETEQ